MMEPIQKMLTEQRALDSEGEDVPSLIDTAAEDAPAQSTGGVTADADLPKVPLTIVTGQWPLPLYKSFNADILIQAIWEPARPPW